MRLLKSIFATSLLLATSAAMVSCSDNDDEDALLLLPFYNSKIEFSEETKAWDECYDESSVNDLVYSGFKFSHSANAAWQSWNGFCPSISKDNADSNPDWVAHQWGSITGGGVFVDVPYMLCFWDSFNEADESVIPKNPSLSIEFTDANLKYFYPQTVALTNTTWGYYAMKDGTAFNRPFEPGDKFTVVIIGLRDGVKTGTVEFDLADGTNILKEWKDCDLRSLGKVNQLVFRMRSTDVGEWGINNPTYFCLDGFRLKFED
ncbi:MAG: DUF4465 domain-containing protein [Muribaculaceae bacterium]|nr:DUF4465 domain-containing protein [Muribaculaceae bacterium]